MTDDTFANRLSGYGDADRIWLYGLVAVTILAAALRLIGLDDHSLWEDELATLQQVRPDLWGMIAGTAMVPAVPISATEVRKRVREGLPVDHLVPPEVDRYIRENRLYL